MSQTGRIRHLRHRRLKGLERGEGVMSRPRLRHLKDWLSRQVAQDLAGSESDVAVTPANATNEMTAAAHGLLTGDLIVLGGTTPPTGLVFGVRASEDLTLSGQPANGDTVTIAGVQYEFRTGDIGDAHAGGQPYLVKVGVDTDATLDNLAAALQADGSGNTHASAAQTLTGVPSDGDTFTVGSVVYTFQDAIDDVVNLTGSAQDVLIGLTVDITAANLALAINGTDSGGREAHPLAAVSLGVGGVFTLSALLVGTAGNVAVSESATNFTEASLTGGAETHSEGTQINGLCAASAVASGGVLNVEAREPGAEGNTLTVTENGANSSWGAAALSGGVSQNYHAIRVDANTFQVAASEDDAFEGTAVTFSDDGAGVTFSNPLSEDGLVAALRAGSRYETIEAATDIDAL